jgi:hypothetical protein
MQEGLFCFCELAGMVWSPPSFAAKPWLLRSTASYPDLRYFGGAGASTSRLRPGSGLGLGFGAFFVSLRPLSLFPMGKSMTQKPFGEKASEAA